MKPNGIITVYEIRYKESSSKDTYYMHNTTSTHSTLNVSSEIEIKVRAYTIAGPGKWATVNASTLGKKIMFYGLNFSSSITADVAQVKNYSVIPINDSSVWLTWVLPPLNDIPPLLYYTVQYGSINSTNVINVASNITNRVISGLHSSLDYSFKVRMVTECNDGPFSESLSPGIM